MNVTVVLCDGQTVNLIVWLEWMWLRYCVTERQWTELSDWNECDWGIVWQKDSELNCVIGMNVTVVLCDGQTVNWFVLLEWMWFWYCVTDRQWTELSDWNECDCSIVWWTESERNFVIGMNVTVVLCNGQTVKWFVLLEWMWLWYCVTDRQWTVLCDWNECDCSIVWWTDSELNFVIGMNVTVVLCDGQTDSSELRRNWITIVLPYLLSQYPRFLLYAIYRGLKKWKIK
jgi:hypothetical protein